MSDKKLVEIKEEYTIMLIDTLMPSLYEGIQSLYSYALKVYEQMGSQNKIGPLKVFQTILKGLPDLSANKIQLETERIKDMCRCREWIDELLKAVIKSNIMLLINNRRTLGDYSKYYDAVKLDDFIHKCYIEIGRAIYNNPDLFRQDYPTLKIKRNQRDACDIIKSCIRQAIRKILPIKLILTDYLTHDDLDDYYIQTHPTQQITHIPSVYAPVTVPMSVPVSRPQTEVELLEDSKSYNLIDDEKEKSSSSSSDESSSTSSSSNTKQEDKQEDKQVKSIPDIFKKYDDKKETTDDITKEVAKIQGNIMDQKKIFDPNVLMKSNKRTSNNERLFMTQLKEDINKKEDPNKKEPAKPDIKNFFSQYAD
jgi:hypothetical protein